MGLSLNTNNFTLVLLASGQGSRMQGNIPKQYYNIPGLNITVLEYIYKKLTELFQHIIITVPREGDIPECVNKITQNNANVKIIRGGATRQESAYLASQEVQTEYILIHDVARPFVSLSDIEKLLQATIKYKACILAKKVTDTIKKSSSTPIPQPPKGALAQNLIKETISRDNLWRAETPQCFDTELYRESTEYCLENNIQVTDDASILEAVNKPVQLMESQDINFKITTEQDFELFLALLEPVKKQRV